MGLGELLRPRSWDEIVGQAKAVRQIRATTECVSRNVIESQDVGLPTTIPIEANA